MTRQQKAAALNLMEIAVKDLDDRTAYLHAPFGLDIPDPFLPIHEVKACRGGYRIMCGRIMSFIVPDQFGVWVKVS